VNEADGWFRRVLAGGTPAGADGSVLELAVHEHTPWSPDRESVILVHGFPDQQDVWDRVVEALPKDELHIVTYDVRGAGASDVPRSTDGYRVELLLADLGAVARATVPDGRRFHLVGHDWGSVALWDAVNAERTPPELVGRVASFTSVSGPSLDHVTHLTRHLKGRRARLLRQGLRSWYIGAFCVPVLPDLALRALGRNAVNGLGLYRANVGRRVRRGRPVRTDVPVLVIRPLRDRFIGEVLYDDLADECSDLIVAEVDAGHWVLATHPQVVADLVIGQVRRHPA
jgi:pimeloyl-ACP methyl ester carboxylesterase